MQYDFALTLCCKCVMLRYFVVCVRSSSRWKEFVECTDTWRRVVLCRCRLMIWTTGEICFSDLLAVRALAKTAFTVAVARPDNGVAIFWKTWERGQVREWKSGPGEVVRKHRKKVGEELGIVVGFCVVREIGNFPAVISTIILPSFFGR